MESYKRLSAIFYKQQRKSEELCRQRAVIIIAVYKSRLCLCQTIRKRRKQNERSKIESHSQTCRVVFL